MRLPIIVVLTLCALCCTFVPVAGSYLVPVSIGVLATSTAIALSLQQMATLRLKRKRAASYCQIGAIASVAVLNLLCLSDSLVRLYSIVLHHAY